MRWFSLFVFVFSLTATLRAHHPEKECQNPHPRIDVIGPLGTCLPMSYRRRYNRPRNLGGKIAYHIAPSSQEAMAWHDATHRCAYKDHRPRIEMHYFYPKPWEALRIGPRKSSSVDEAEENGSEYDSTLGEAQLQDVELDDQMALPREMPLTNEPGLIE